MQPGEVDEERLSLLRLHSAPLSRLRRQHCLQLERHHFAPAQSFACRQFEHGLVESDDFPHALIGQGQQKLGP